jgi:hypothetical protein
MASRRNTLLVLLFASLSPFKDMGIDLDIDINHETSIDIGGKIGSFGNAQLDATTALSVAIDVTAIGVKRKLPDKSKHFMISMHFFDPRYPTYMEDGQ